ncbi:homocysteine S-methyltransferase family protein [Nocardioides sp. YIM 152315]|uniref:homocysteine S-methyltransferase family protein n=1 Tax=Nocardioides sp. YIM 152315 TaxID=3031760 RepID=UPI0023DC7D6C|nr:homocysteine S-methyltransferase family protein [Nocardioides sp. YIM 152315]MDF1606288.1 homocysteine S-methyltransferase family protein [Nocardioides sp. YIM 152315]
MTEPDLSWLSSGRYVSDGGLETDLIFHRGVDLPEFASFPLVEDAGGRELLRRYYDRYAAIARRAGAGLTLESPTWRANPDWGVRVGYGAAALARVNTAAVDFLHGLREEYADLDDVRLIGVVGPRGDGYVAGQWDDPDDAAEYHRPQVAALAHAGADLVAAYTLTTPEEGIGIVRAARSAGVPVLAGFTVETDGRLPDGTTLRDAVERVDAEDAPDGFIVNCAHPTHIAPGLTDGAWRRRIVQVNPNASTQSHAELDAAETLDEGDLDLLTSSYDALRPLLPSLGIVGGCCGTDARHVAALWGVGATERQSTRTRV